MPTNRTRRKRSRTDLDEYKLGQLVHGPDHCLLRGLGYHCAETRAFYSEASEASREAILEAMQSDWAQHSETVLLAADGKPWAQHEFGEPK